MDNNFWNNRYTLVNDLYGTKPNQYFKEKIEFLKSGQLLIPGEGEGRQAIYAAAQGWQVTAFDLSKVAQQHALEKAENMRLSLNYQLSKAEDFSYPKETYDCAAVIYFHLPPGGRSNVHKRIAASVKAGGHIIIEAFHPRQLGYSSGGPKSEDMLYTSEMISQDFVGWEFIEKLEGEVLLEEGSGHAGPAYVTRLFARKKE
ncbi:MAG: methyltransferase domain-containing protein [Anditalea sp.]